MTEEKEKKKKESGEISRREFLKDAGLVVGGAAIGSAVLLAACAPSGGATATVTKTVETTKTVGAGATVTVETTKTVGAGSTITATVTSPPVTKTVTATAIPTVAAAPTIKFTVNGYKYELQVGPHQTLMDVLRWELGLTGTKNGCTGLGECGACTVLVDGGPILSCITLAIECDGKSIETVEGLEKGGKLHPLQESFIKNHGFQCGYCTPGMLMTAKALLQENPNPTDAEVREWMANNLCRCGDYEGIVNSVLEAAGIMREGR